MLLAVAAALATSAGAAMVHTTETTYLPDATASRVVTVAKDGPAEAGVTVLTEGVAIKETGPKATVKRFGEVYAFAPAFIAVHRDEPTMISFWNLQPDDEHDFMLVDPQSHRADARVATAAEGDGLRVHLPPGRPLHLLLHHAPAGDERAAARAAATACRETTVPERSRAGRSSHPSRYSSVSGTSFGSTCSMRTRTSAGRARTLHTSRSGCAGVQLVSLTTGVRVIVPVPSEFIV